MNANCPKPKAQNPMKRSLLLLLLPIKMARGIYKSRVHKGESGYRVARTIACESESRQAAGDRARAAGVSLSRSRPLEKDHDVRKDAKGDPVRLHVRI